MLKSATVASNRPFGMDMRAAVSPGSSVIRTLSTAIVRSTCCCLLRNQSWYVPARSHGVRNVRVAHPSMDA